MMKLIIILFCLLLQTFLNINEKIPQYSLVDRYIERLRPLLLKLGLNRGWFSLLIILLPILILIVILNVIFSFWLFYFIYGVLVLLMCLNVTDYRVRLSEYFAAFNSNNIEKSQIEAENFVKYPIIQDKEAISRAVTHGIFFQSLTDIFSVIFWFILLGPFGAVLYHLVAAICDRDEKGEYNLFDTYNAANYLKNILDWVPVRLVTLTYALISHFTPVFSLWIDRLGASLSDNKQFIIEAGLTALNVSPTDALHSDVSENYLAIGLVWRTLWTWIIFIAALSVAAWLF